jgi:hypothetical protein
MSQDEFKKINEGLNLIQSPNIMSVGNIMLKLKKEGLPVPTRQTISNWSSATSQPKINNLCKRINPAGIETALFYYPEVKQVVIKYFNKKAGRPRLQAS